MAHITLRALTKFELVCRRLCDDVLFVPLVLPLRVFFLFLFFFNPFYRILRRMGTPSVLPEDRIGRNII